MQAHASASPFDGLAAWVDMYDHGPWDNPTRSVRRVARHGATTLFVQTANHGAPSSVFRRQALGRMIEAAHRRGMAVIAWYLPGFAGLRRDWRRIRTALALRTARGQQFDGFALDIESTAVADVGRRTRRMLGLSRRLRRHVGPAYPLGAIVPDPIAQRYWPDFPLADVAAAYDAILPMAYWTYDTNGASAVRRRTCRAVGLVRSRSWPLTPAVHVVGGIADAASAAEVRGFSTAAVRCGADGASLYDAPITRAAQWRELARMRR